jgi:hypothetical protein
MNYSAIKVQMTHFMEWAVSGSKLTYAALAVGLLVFLVLYRFFFKDLPGLIHSVGYSVSTKSAASGAAGQSKSSRVKLLFGLLLPIAAGYGAYVWLPKWFPAVFH